MPTKAAYGPAAAGFERRRHIRSPAPAQVLAGRGQQRVHVVARNQEIRIAEQDERRMLCFLGGQYRAEIGIRRNNNAVLGERPHQDFLIPGSLHGVRPYVEGVVTGGHEEVRQPRRQCVVDKKSQAECGSGISRSIADAAAKRRHSRISSVWRSGYPERISRSPRPPASNRSTVATGIRRWRTHGTPAICAGSTVMRSKFFTVC